jgi:hypothetical protein
MGEPHAGERGDWDGSAGPQLRRDSAALRPERPGSMEAKDRNLPGSVASMRGISRESVALSTIESNAI